jgi:glycerol uptake facilitator-like aquaporin
MKPVLYLRVASILTLIHSILHTVGGVFSKPAPGTATMVAATMRTRFEVLGAMRSYADFYRGFGLVVTIFLAMDAAILWQLASMAKSDAARLRPILVCFLVGYLAMTVNSSIYFFSGPVIAEILIALCLGAAILTAKRADDRAQAGAQPEFKTAGL